MGKALNSKITKKKLPIYISVYNRLCDTISNMTPGKKLPTEETLIKEFAVSRNTLRQALQLLEEDRLIHRKQGSGAYISRRPFMDSASLNRYFTVEVLLNKLGISWELGDLQVTLQDVDKLESEILSIPKGSPIYVFDRIYRGAKDENSILAHLLDFVPVKPEAKLPYGKNKEDIVHAVESTGFNSSSIVSAISAGRLYSNLFRVKPSSPLLLLQQLVGDEKGNPVFFNKTLFNSNINGLTLRIDRIQF